MNNFDEYDDRPTGIFHQKSRFSKAISSLLIGVMLTQHGAILADVITQSAQQGESFAHELLSEDFMVTESDNQLTFPSAGTGNAIQFNINELYPGSSGDTQRPSSFYFPDTGMGNVDSLKGAFDSSPSTSDIGNQASQALGSDALTENPSLGGIAYQIAQNSANEPARDFSDDPMFKRTEELYGNMDVIAKEFTECTEVSSFTETEFTASSPDYETCERLNTHDGECKITHRYRANFIDHHSGPYNLEINPESDSVSVWIGRVGDNYWSGWCTIFEEVTAIKVIKPEAITKVTLEYAKYDDYMQVLIGPPGEEVKVWNGPNSNFPPETGGACELSTSWSQNLNVDVTPYFNNINPNDVVRFKIRVSVAGNGEGFGRLRIHYDRSKAVVVDEWDDPHNCSSLITGIKDGFADGSYSCTKQPPLRNGNCTYANGFKQCDCTSRYEDGEYVQYCPPPVPICRSSFVNGKLVEICEELCTYVDGVKLCESDMKPAPLDDISPFCAEITAQGDFHFNKGPMDCYIDANGNEQCPVNEGNVKSSCGSLENDPQCGFIRSTCLEGAEGGSGECYVYEDTYDCGFTAKIPTVVSDTKYECAGPIRCMGTDCVDPEREQSTDFARVSALLEAAETMGQDLSCEGLDSDGDFTGTENVNCTVFKGEGQTCKKAVGGVQNCCEKPKGISLTDYVSLIMGAKKMNTAIMGIEAGSNLSFIKSGYETLTSPITGAYDVISKPFTGLIDNIKGVTDTISSTITDLTDIMKDKIADMFNTVFQTTAQNTGATAAIGAGATEGTQQLAQSAGEQIVSGAGTALSVIGTVYTIYAVTMLAIQMIFKCTEDELELNVNRVLKNTHHIGSYCHKKVLGVCIEKREAYCVFKSPLSRILQEQVRGQLGMTFGDPENPSCDGLAIEQLGAIDWDLVNLDEWLAILSETGNLKDMNIDMESLTGSGSSMNLGSRDDAIERTLERFEDLDIEQIRRDSTNLQGAPVFTP